MDFDRDFDRTDPSYDTGSVSIHKTRVTEIKGYRYFDRYQSHVRVPEAAGAYILYGAYRPAHSESALLRIRPY